MIFLCLVLLGHSEPSLARVRVLYEQSMFSEDSCKVLLSLLKDYDQANEPLLAGYRAGAMMVMAKYVFSPWAKWKCFSQGKELLEGSVAADRRDVELIFIRYTIQLNCPFFLHYRQSVEADRLFIETNVDRVEDAALRSKIRSFLKRN